MEQIIINNNKNIQLLLDEKKYDENVRGIFFLENKKSHCNLFKAREE